MSDNVSLEWHNGVAVFTVLDIDKATVDEWAQAIEDIFTAWDDDRPILTVHDFSKVRIHRVPTHLRQQTRRISKLREDMPTRTAIVMPRTIASVMTLMRILVRTLYQHKDVDRERKLFSDVYSAIAWVREVEVSQ